uniref:Uncharacterized protein n=1 Tax=Oryza brachyantha TaxID=4533 RepID=J3N549_ORYBR
MEQKQQQEQQAEAPPPGLGLTAAEYTQLRPTVEAHHRYAVGPGQCSSLLAQRIHAPAAAVWAVVRRFDCPQVYKHFIRSCVLRPDPDSGSDDLRPGRLREPRLRNYRSVTTVSDLSDDQICTTVVLESYIVDVPEGNTEEDTRLFADTVIRLNLQKLKSVSEANAAAAAAAPPPPAAE